MGQAKERSKLTNRSNLSTFAQDTKEFAANKANLQREVDLTNEQREAEYQFGLDVRALQDLALYEQFKKNEQDVDTQLIWNKEAADAAVASQDAAFEERVGLAKQSLQDQKISFGRTKLATREATQDAKQGARDDIRSAKQDARQTIQRTQLAKRQTVQDARLQSRQTIGQARFVADQSIQDARLSASQSIAQANLRQGQISEAARLNASQSIDSANLQAGFQVDQADFNLSQALVNSQFSRRGANLDFRATGLSIASERSSLQEKEDLLNIQSDSVQLRERNAVADRNFEMVQATIKSVQDSGAAAARGQRGRSAQGTQQAVLASFAFDTAKISDTLYRTKESLELERQQIAAQQRGVGRQRGILNQKEDLAKDRLSLTMEKLDSEDSFARAARDMAVSQAEASRDLSISQAQDTRDLTISQSKQDRNLARKQAKQSRNRQIQKSKGQRNLQIKQSQQNRRQTTKQARQTANLQTRQTRQSKKQSIKQSKRDRNQELDRLAKTFGIDKKVFELNKSRLGEELISAAQARKTAIKEISRGLVQANIQTNSQRMLDPKQFALPDPPRPIQAEMPILVPPAEPDKVSRESYQVPRPPQQSGTSKILGGLAMVAGVAATIATAGAALPGLAAGTAATLGTVGTVAGGVSSGLGLIGKYTY